MGEFSARYVEPITIAGIWYKATLNSNCEPVGLDLALNRVPFCVAVDLTADLLDPRDFGNAASGSRIDRNAVKLSAMVPRHEHFRMIWAPILRGSGIGSFLSTAT